MDLLAKEEIVWFETAIPYGFASKGRGGLLQQPLLHVHMPMKKIRSYKLSNDNASISTLISSIQPNLAKLFSQRLLL